MYKLTEVLNALLLKYNKLIKDRGPDYEPRLCIYMNIDFYRECLYEIRDWRSYQDIVDFCEDSKLKGYDVWKVTDRKHPPWVIVDLDRKTI
jgi:hypothetical protein